MGRTSPSTLAFRVRGMDCAEEIAALKQAVGPVVGGEERLAFHLLSGKMLVEGSEAKEPEILAAVARAGLKAESWDSGRTGGEGAWERYGRALLCVLSGALAAGGLAVEVGHDGSLLGALAAGQEAGHRVPLPAVLLYLGAIASGARYVLPKAWQAARSLRPDMNLLMTIAVIGALAIGELFEAASVTFLFALALVLESWSVARARQAISALMDLSPETARLRDPATGEVIVAAVEDVPIGAVVLVRAGERVPLDGEVTTGETAIDQSPITGESVPVAKSPGDEIFAGTINGEGAFELRSTRPAADTTLARIVSMVEAAQSRRAPSEQWVERFARLYTPAVMVMAFALAVVPPVLLGRDWGAWFYTALVMLVIACPCALVISTPVSIVAGLTAAARSGVLIKGGAFLSGWSSRFPRTPAGPSPSRRARRPARRCRFEHTFGYLRGCIQQAVYRCLDCGILERGFARLECEVPELPHETRALVGPVGRRAAPRRRPSPAGRPDSSQAPAHLLPLRPQASR